MNRVPTRVTAVAARAGAGAAVLVLVSALLVGSQVQTPAQRAANAAPPPVSVITAEVEQGVVASGTSVRATLRPEHLTAVNYPGGKGESRAVVSGLPKRVGDTVRAGEVAAVVSGRPLIVLPGAVQSYRDLRHGSRGPDVDQLRAALAGLGLRTADEAGRYGVGTAAAVRQLYANVGFEAPRDPELAATTGAADDPQLAVRVADRALQAARRRADAAARAVALAADDLSAARAAGDPGGVRAAETAHRTAVDEAADAQSAVADARDAHDKATARARLLEPGMYLPMAETVFVARLPARVLTLGAALGGAATGDILRVGSGRTRAVGQLTREQEATVRVGTDAEAELADGARLTGRVVAVEPAGAAGAGAENGAGQPASGSGQPASGSGQSGTGTGAPGSGAGPGEPAPAGGGRPEARGDQPGAGGSQPGSAGVVAEFAQDVPAAANGQEITLRFTVRASPPDALVVPVTAIHDDGTNSWVRLSTGQRVVDVPVEVGVIADGRAAVVAPALTPGARVVVGEAGTSRGSRR